MSLLPEVNVLVALVKLQAVLIWTLVHVCLCYLLTAHFYVFVLVCASISMHKYVNVNLCSFVFLHEGLYADLCAL